MSLKMANSADPDEEPHFAHLGLRYLLMFPLYKSIDHVHTIAYNEFRQATTLMPNIHTWLI